jgi:hypothetical protein
VRWPEESGSSLKEKMNYIENENLMLFDKSNLVKTEPITSRFPDSEVTRICEELQTPYTL